VSIQSPRVFQEQRTRELFDLFNSIVLIYDNFNFALNSEFN
jgi:hypothetical protein